MFILQLGEIENRDSEFLNLPTSRHHPPFDPPLSSCRESGGWHLQHVLVTSQPAVNVPSHHLPATFNNIHIGRVVVVVCRQHGMIFGVDWIPKHCTAPPGLSRLSITKVLTSGGGVISKVMLCYYFRVAYKNIFVPAKS